MAEHEYKGSQQTLVFPQGTCAMILPAYYMSQGEHMVLIRMQLTLASKFIKTNRIGARGIAQW